VYVLFRTVISPARGLTGVTGRECWRYQTNTMAFCQQFASTATTKSKICSPLWPNFVGSEDAPTTAKRDDVKKVFRAASISIVLSR
jgi:hypothetical protein